MRIVGVFCYGSDIKLLIKNLSIVGSIWYQELNKGVRVHFTSAPFTEVCMRALFGGS